MKELGGIDCGTSTLRRGVDTPRRLRRFPRRGRDAVTLTRGHLSPVARPLTLPGTWSPASDSGVFGTRLDLATYRCPASPSPSQGRGAIPSHLAHGGRTAELHSDMLLRHIHTARQRSTTAPEGASGTCRVPRRAPDPSPCGAPGLLRLILLALGHLRTLPRSGIQHSSPLPNDERRHYPTSLRTRGLESHLRSAALAAVDNGRPRH
jgi:hypothetical protein